MRGAIAALTAPLVVALLIALVAGVLRYIVRGRQNQVTRLCGSLQVNVDETRWKLGWFPPYRSVSCSHGPYTGICRRVVNRWPEGAPPHCLICGSAVWPGTQRMECCPGTRSPCSGIVAFRAAA